MGTVLGLDLGTNSIGWALIKNDSASNNGTILGLGSRIIPMSQDVLGNFDAGNSISQTAERTGYRGIRRLRERHLLRRERLHRVLNVIGFLPEHYASQLDFEKYLGKFRFESETKLPYSVDATGNHTFVFQHSFNEMLSEFRNRQPQLFQQKSNGESTKIPYDWTIYYLRKKALQFKIEKEELAWLLLNFNQKRGYYQLRGEEEEENPNKKVEFHSLKIIDIIADESTNNRGEKWYSLYLENGWIYRRSSKTSLDDWKGIVKDFIVTTDLNDDGTVKTDKEGSEKRSFRAPSEDDWTLLKKKSEADIEESKQTVGAYIYNTLLNNPNQKIRGKLVRTIERKFYKDELITILKKQIELQPELFTDDLYSDCVRELYKNNEAHQNILSKRDFVHLFVNDIIFYQRPLKSQKSTIGNCTLEYRIYKKEGIYIEEYLKALPKSHPLYQEFRIWQWMYNLKIYKQDDDTDVTNQFIKDEFSKVQLFEFLNNRKEIEQKGLLKFYKLSDKLYRWNYVEDKAYPCNLTKTMFTTRLAKVEDVPTNFLTPETEIKLWHIVYSVTDKIEYEKALNTFALKHGLDQQSFVECFKRFPPFKSDYGSFSAKAIKKLLNLMRIGKYWQWESIDNNTQMRIDKIITGEYDEKIKDIVREKTISLAAKEHFQGLPLWLAQYVVYERHSEAGSIEKWNTTADLEAYIKDFKQHSLRNPIVEQVVVETLRVVKDVWQQYGNGAKGFLNEIHVELGREMKNTAEDRKRITSNVLENENTNLRIKLLLAELQKDVKVENVRSYSPIQQEILKIYEDGVINSGIEIPEDILKISKTAQPSSSDLHRYKLWIEQKYRSPYTGAVIPLGKLFTPAYEIEHIIPQSRYYDDSMSNKVICEASVNHLKDKQLALEFIKNHHGQLVETGYGNTVRVFDEAAYLDFIKQHYTKNYSKKNKLLLEEIPDKMIERQLNDTRYISKLVFSLLSNIVREATNDDGFNSKNVIPGNGKITSTLKQDWGLNDVWNNLILHRFERMNVLTDSKGFTAWNENHQKFLPTIPLEFSKGFQKKRIDHRHHALDALVIACITRDHVNLLNNKHANADRVRYDLQRKLRHFEPVTYKDNKTGQLVSKEIPKEFIKPWRNFTIDAQNTLEKVIISFKQNLRIINKVTNKHERYIEKNGKMTKELVAQTEGKSWAIRKPLHKETVFGKVSLRKVKTVRLTEALKNREMIVDKLFKKEIERLILVNAGDYNPLVIHKYFKDKQYQFNDTDVSKVDIYYFDTENAAVRKSLDTSFTEKKIKESVTDTGIQTILLNHLYAKNNQAELAFSPEGIEDMNNNMLQLNQGNHHHAIYKVRVYEPLGNKFKVGTKGCNNDKYVEAAKGTNLFFAIYTNESGQRTYETIPLNIVIERLKQGLTEVPEVNEKGHQLLFHLSPNDLVYVPTEEERENVQLIDWQSLDKIQHNRIYKMVSCTGGTCFFILHNVANTIVNKMEFSALNKMERSITGAMIKEICIKLKVDRLGNIQL